MGNVTILILPFILVASECFSQQAPVFTHDESIPPVGTVYYEQDETFSVAGQSIALSGVGQTWDFSGENIQFPNVDSFSIKDPINTEFGWTFQDAEFAVEQSDILPPNISNLEYYSSTQDVLRFLGFAEDSGDFDLYSLQPIIPLPFGYGQIHFDTSEVSNQGLVFIELEYVSQGVLVMPALMNYTYLNVALLKWTTSSLSNPTPLVVYRWYHPCNILGEVAEYRPANSEVRIHQIDTASFPCDYLITAIGENQKYENVILVYPNPASDFLYLDNLNSNTKPSLARLLDLNGQVIINWTNVLHQSRLDVSTVANGLYIAELCLENRLLHKRVVIQ